MKTPITYYGGKQALLKYILPLIPEHRLYCEPFFGGGAVFFAKPKAEVEVINDINGEVINFFKVIKTKFPELQKEVQSTLHSRELYKEAMNIYNNPKSHSDVKRAWALWTATNQGFSGMIGSWGFGKTNSKEKSLANKREAFLREYEDRLKTAQIESNNALKVIARCNEKDAFIYCDPPYICSDQGHYSGYTEAQYKELLDVLSKLKAKFLLSSYPSKILMQYIKKNGWRVQKIVKHVAVTKHTDKMKTEVLVFNYDEKLGGQLTGIPNENKKTKTMKTGNPYSKITKEIQLIERFLAFHDKILYKNTLEILIEDLQRAIQKKEITKKSPVAKDIMVMQDLLITTFNKMGNAKHIILKPATLKRFKSILEKYENSYDDLDVEYVKRKKKKMGLSGLENKVNVMASTDFANLRFNTIGFKDRWLSFIGDPAPGFTAMVFGMPKMGKSYLCVDFAGYLARNHGRVLYIAKEEKLDKTLQDKLKQKEVAHENLTVADGIPDDLSPYDFIFLDSVNKLGLTPKDLERLKSENKGKSFIYIFQATKGGKFKGNNEFQHDVDVVIEVPEQGKAVQYGRFNQGGQMDIFSESLKKVA